MLLLTDEAWFHPYTPSLSPPRWPPSYHLLSLHPPPPPPSPRHPLGLFSDSRTHHQHEYIGQCTLTSAFGSVACKTWSALYHVDSPNPGRWGVWRPQGCMQHKLLVQSIEAKLFSIYITDRAFYCSLAECCLPFQDA